MMAIFVIKSNKNSTAALPICGFTPRATALRCGEILAVHPIQASGGGWMRLWHKQVEVG